MTTTLEERYKRLLLAANALLENHMDLGDCFVSEDNDDDDYPTDSDGDRWYHDWFELREAINECESDEDGTTPATPEITRQALDEGKIRHDIKKVAFEGPETPDRGYTMRVSYLNPPADADALVEVMKDKVVVREFLFPAYKIYNLQAHFGEIVDSEIEKNDNGYRQAAWCGIGPV